MYEITDRTKYFLVDRIQGKTFYVGGFNELIKMLANRIHYENRQLFNDDVYEEWDFSGGDTYWGKEMKKVFGLVRTWDYISGEYVWKRRWYYKYLPVKFVRPYMITDDCGRIIDFRQWEKQIMAARMNRSYSKYGTTDGAKYGDKFRCYRYSTDTYSFRCTPVPNVHKRKGWGSHPHKGILNTIRNKDFIRPKARIDYFYWDEFSHTDKCWKTNHKCRHQWQKHLK